MDETTKSEIRLLHDRVCHALKDPVRIMILYALAERPFYVNELAEYIGQPQSTVSRHLAVLRERSLVETVRDRKLTHYSLADERIIQALDLMRAMLRDVTFSQASLLEENQLPNT